MIRISFKALTNILLEKGHIFTIRKSDQHKDKLVYLFVVGNDYPNVGPITHYGKDGVDEGMETVRQMRNKGKVVVLYDTTQDVLIGASCEVLEIVKDAKREAIKKAFSKSSPTEPNKPDEFGRQIQTE